MRRRHLHFFNNVMARLGFHGWTLRPCKDSYCWEKQKRIDYNPGYDGDPRQIILHEIAHIGTARFCNQRHNKAFWDRLEDLNSRFLGKSLDGHQLKHKTYTSEGRKALCYDSRGQKKP